MLQYRAQRLRNPDGSLSATLLGPNGVVEAAEAYLHFLQDLGRSWHTVRAYASDLALFFDFLDRTGAEWQRVGMAQIAAFSAHLRGTNRARPAATNVVLLGTAAPSALLPRCSASMTFMRTPHWRRSWIEAGSSGAWCVAGTRGIPVLGWR